MPNFSPEEYRAQAQKVAQAAEHEIDASLARELRIAAEMWGRFGRQAAAEIRQPDPSATGQP